MNRSLRHSAVFILVVLLLAGCGLTGQGSATPTPTATALATPTTPALSCAFTVDTPATAPTGALPPGLGQPAGSLSMVYPHWDALALASADEGWAIGRQGIPPSATFLHKHAGTWSTVANTAPYSALRGPLLALTMVSPTDGWAVGEEGAILHYTGGKWTVAVPAGSLPHMPLTPYIPEYVDWLSSVSMVSATEGWAVGQGSTSANPEQAQPVPIFVHYTGGRWTVTDPATLHTTGIPQVVAMVSASDGWALGAGLVARYQQGLWHADPAYQANPAWQHLQFTSISMASPAEGWAVGNDGALAHFCGGTWTLAGPANLASPNALAGTNLTSVVMVSPTEGWIAGTRTGSKPPSGFLLHYLNGRWQAVSLPLVAGCTPTALAMSAPDDGWVLGTCVDQQQTGGETFALHYHSGAWTFSQG